MKETAENKSGLSEEAVSMVAKIRGTNIDLIPHRFQDPLLGIERHSTQSLLRVTKEGKLVDLMWLLQMLQY